MKKGLIVVLIVVVVLVLALVIKFVRSPIKDVLVSGVKMISDIAEQNKMYREADIEELVKLEDNAVYEAIGSRVLAKIDFNNYESSFSALNEYEQTFWVVYEFDAENLNGGLCQYFGNTRGRDCDRIVDDLKTVGADKYASLYTDFINENEVEISAFSSGWDESWESRYNKYPYDDFDEAFGKLYMEEKALESYLAEYVRENSEYFK